MSDSEPAEDTEAPTPEDLLSAIRILHAGALAQAQQKVRTDPTEAAFQAERADAYSQILTLILDFRTDGELPDWYTDGDYTGYEQISRGWKAAEQSNQTSTEVRRNIQ
jgi:hypothetical protein